MGLEFIFSSVAKTKIKRYDIKLNFINFTNFWLTIARETWYPLGSNWHRNYITRIRQELHCPFIIFKDQYFCQMPNFHSECLQRDIDQQARDRYITQVHKPGLFYFSVLFCLFVFIFFPVKSSLLHKKYSLYLKLSFLTKIYTLWVSLFIKIWIEKAFKILFKQNF